MINEYEAEIRIKTKTGERTIVIRDWAYDARDAMTQIAIKAQKDVKPHEEFLGMTRLGPPEVSVIAATRIGEFVKSFTSSLPTKKDEK